MELSHRITHLTAGGSDGWELFYRARAMVARGEPVIELTIGEHDIRTDPIILEAMECVCWGLEIGWSYRVLFDVLGVGMDTWTIPCICPVDTSIHRCLAVLMVCW